MLQKFYTVYDRHVGYGFPFAQPNDACAADTLNKVLFELSCNMKNAFSRSDA